MPKKCTLEEIENMVKDYNNGISVTDIAKKYSRALSTVIQKLSDKKIYKQRNFTKEDIDFLKEYYPKGKWNEIFKRFPDTTKQSIANIACKKGIKSDYFLSNRWSKYEIDLLRKYYPIGEIKKLLTLLPNRTYDAITTKSLRLGLKSREFWTDEEDSIMRKFYPIIAVEEMCNLLPNRTRNAIILHAVNIGLRNVSQYSEEEDEFILNNWENMSDNELAMILNRNSHAIQAKRLRHGLLRLKEGSSYNDLSEFVRRNNLDWKKRSMKKCRYKCIITGDRFQAIHHLHGLNLILNEVLDNLNISIKSSMNNYTDTELRNILKEFRRIQDTYPLGLCLREDIHKMFHNIYGYGNNTETQWNQFINDIKSKKYLIQNNSILLAS